MCARSMIGRKRRQEGRADVLGEGEVRFPVAAAEVVVEDASDAARPAAVGDMKYSSAQALNRG